MDHWFLNPFRYKDHRKDGFNIACLNTELEMGAVKKDELLKYYKKIRAKVRNYLSNLTVNELAEYPEDCKFTKFDLI